jgi:hypothetical protein
MCQNYIGYQITTPLELGNQIGEVLQVDLEGPPGYTCEFLVNFRLAFTHFFIRHW